MELVTIGNSGFGWCIHIVEETQHLLAYHLSVCINVNRNWAWLAVLERIPESVDLGRGVKLKQSGLFRQLVVLYVSFNAGVSAIVGREVSDDDLVLLVLLIKDGIKGAVDLAVEIVVMGA